MPNRCGIINCVITLMFVAGACPAVALTCGEKSSLFTELGDEYFNAEVVPASSSVVPEFTPGQLFDALSTYSLKTGLGEHTTCTDGDNGAVPSTDEVTIEEIEVETRLGEVYINALEVHPQDTGNHHERIALSVQNRHVTVVNENELVEVIRQRRASSTGSHFEEIRLALKRENSGIAVQRLHYVNGELAEWLHWLLSP